MERLDDAHRRPPGPEQFAGGGRTKGDRHVAKLDCTATGIGVHNDFGGNGVGEAQIVRGSHAVDKHPRLVAAPDGVDDGARVGRIWLLGEFVEPGLIVKAAIDPSEGFGLCQALQCFVDGVPRRQIDEIAGRPNLARFGRTDAVEHDGFQTGRIALHVRNL